MEGNGLLQVVSRLTLDETVKRLELELTQRGLQVFARVDHSAEAAKVGLKMRPTKLLIFGSPKGGTPVMDLPLKALIAEDENGKVWVSYNSPEYLQQRHGIPQELVKNIAGVGAVVAKAVE